MHKPFVSPILKKLAKRVGVRVNVEPRWGFVGQIVTPKGEKRYFREAHFDLNPLGATEISRDKDYASYFMSLMGYPTIPGRTFFEEHFRKSLNSRSGIDAGYRYAKQLGFPVVVKPNSKSQGVGVAKVWNRKEFYRAARFALRKDRVILVQKAIVAQDYRIVVLNDEVISAYERLPLAVTGDGRTSVKGLLAKLQKRFVRGRDVTLLLNRMIFASA